MDYARFWQRAAGFIIDVAVVSAITGVCALLMGINPLGPLMGDAEGWQALDAVLFFVAWFYSAPMESSRIQATLGKMALGIRVTDLEGQRLSFDKATGRFFGEIVSALIAGVGYIVAAFTQYRQTLHDKMAGTLVLTR